MQNSHLLKNPSYKITECNFDYFSRVGLTWTFPPSIKLTDYAGYNPDLVLVHHSRVFHPSKVWITQLRIDVQSGFDWWAQYVYSLVTKHCIYWWIEKSCLFWCLFLHNIIRKFKIKLSKVLSIEYVYWVYYQEHLSCTEANIRCYYVRL